MAKITLADLTQTAAQADDPGFASPRIPKPGGVDPLGLRQVNFDLMDKVFPGLNNVARHVRPFVVITWAWRRAHQLAQELGTHDVTLHQLQDFVDRIDVIFTWSQFLRNPEAPLPGKQVLQALLGASQWKFGGATWDKQRDVRRLSTALSAPINYGPALKMLGWIHPHPEYPRVMIPSPSSAPALDAFEAGIGNLLDHEAFCKFGAITVTRKEAQTWAGAWAMEDVRPAEAGVMCELLLGAEGQHGRRHGVGLILAAAAHCKSVEEADIRPPMEGPPMTLALPTELLEVRNAWRRVQVRQLFRLSLEALLHWTIMKLDGSTLPSEALVTAFGAAVPTVAHAATADEWCQTLRDTTVGPTALIQRLELALDALDTASLAQAIAAGIVFCLAEDPGSDAQAERTDRLPLFRARREAAALGGGSPAVFVRHILESWVLAQHAYWSVGRGLADARAGGKTLLRLRVILDEGGWTLTPVKRSRPPAPTPDRLGTMLSLMTECGLFDQIIPGAGAINSVE